MLVASLCTGIACFFINSYYTGRKLGYTSFMQLKDVVPYYFVAGIVSVIIYLVNYWNISAIFALISQIIMAVALLFIFCKLFKIKEFDELIKIFFSINIKVK